MNTLVIETKFSSLVFLPISLSSNKKPRPPVVDKNWVIHCNFLNPKR